MLATLAHRRVFLPLVLVLSLVICGFIFLRGPLEIPALKIEPLYRIAGYPLRNSVIEAWLSMLIILTLAFLGTRKMRDVPRGVQNLVETIIETFLTLTEKAAGRRDGRRFFPLITTIFLFVLVANWLGIVPGMGTIGKVVPAEEVIHEAEEHGESLDKVKLFVMQEGGVIPFGLTYTLEGQDHTSYDITAAEFAQHEEELAAQGLTAGHLIGFLRPANTDVNTPMALAIVSAIFVEFWGISTLGFFSYMGKFFNFRRLLRGNIFLGIIDVFVGLLELIGESVRLISFTFRLFGNTFAGEVLILIFAFLVPLLIPVFAFGMELFFGAIQAFIFAMLTLVFAIMAVTGHGDGGHEEQHG